VKLAEKCLKAMVIENIAVENAGLIDHLNMRIGFVLFVERNSILKPLLKNIVVISVYEKHSKQKRMFIA
jgi:hypothetical protein